MRHRDLLPTSEDLMVAVAQMGARMHYAVPRLLHAARRLERFYADICATRGWPRLLRCVPSVVRPDGLRRLLAREPGELPRGKLTAFSHFGWNYANRLRTARTRSERTWVNLWAGEQFGRLVSQQDWGRSDSIYAFNNAALEILSEARHRGVRGILEQTIAPRETQIRLLREQEQAFPAWSNRFCTDLYSDWAIRRQHAEWMRADLILCGSSFVRDCIQECGGPVQKCRVVPYGVEAPSGGNAASTQVAVRRPLRVLTVGTVGIRKGSPYVLAAAREMGAAAQFRMVGGLDAPRRIASELGRHVQMTGAVPRTAVNEHLQWADVFLLPSVCEGSATVVYEALAAGLPCICTPNVGSVVRHGMDGWIVPVGDVSETVQYLLQFKKDQELLWQQSRNAKLRAAQFGLAQYGQRLVSVLDGS